MVDRIEPALVEIIEEIVTRRVREELKERAKLITRDQFTEAMERIDRRFEAADKRFEAMQTEMNRRFEESNRRFDAMRTEMNRRFEESNQRFNHLEKIVVENSQILRNIQSQLGKPFEQFARNMVIRLLEGEGIPHVKLTKRHFKDTTQLVFPPTEDIEIDGFSETPSIIVEITSILRDLKKVERFLDKKRFVESLYHQNFRGFFIASGTELPHDQLAEVTILLRKQGCEFLNL